MDRRMQHRGVLSQQARVTVHILQLPLLELRKYMQQELLENPALEESSPEKKEDLENIENVESPPGENWELEHPGRYDEDRERYRETLITMPETLEDHLRWQLGMCVEGPDLEIGEYIIGSLDENGYLKASVGDIASEFNTDTAHVDGVLELVRTFDPPGVAARDLKECLLIQLKVRGKEDTLEYRIIDECLEELERKDYAAIAKKLKVELKEEEKARAHINLSSLEPKPGRSYFAGTPIEVIPDIILSGENGVYEVELNNMYSPTVTVSPFYEKLFKSKDTDEPTKAYLKKKRERANWIINAVAQRQMTIKRIAEFLVARQKEHIDDPSVGLKPLTMSEAAKALSINASTVSRAVSGKYIQTDTGAVALKTFFSQALPQEDGSVVSASAIKSRIESIVKGEDPLSPLTDKRISEALAADEIKVSRRTIAKYREELKILPASRRRS